MSRLQHTCHRISSTNTRFLICVPATRMLTTQLQLNAIHTPAVSDPLSFTVLYSNKINHTRTDLFFLGVYDTQEPI